MSEWQPISTAPKDGTIVLLFNAMWFAPVAARYHDEEWIAVWDGEPIYSRQPTHWQPIPQPPSE